LTRGAGLGGRAEWQPSPPAVAALGSDGGVLYQGSNSADAGDLFRSTDGGWTWTRVSDGLPGESGVEGLLLVGTELFAATAEGAFRSPDDGGTWSAASHGTAGIRGVESLLLHQGKAYVGLTTNSGGGRRVWRSGDAGATWLGDPGTPPGAARALLSYGDAVWAGLLGAARGVYRSTDAGITWSAMSDGLAGDALFVNRLADLEGELYLASEGSGVYRWDGASWVEAGLAREFVDELLPVAGVLVAGSALGEHILYSRGPGRHLGAVRLGLRGR
jgi:photosystem II stability/assembly factor-like uncharacterized protein